MGRYRPAVASDPYTALLRDSIADGPNVKPVVSEQEMAVAAEQQLQALEQLALQQRRAHQHMINILKDAEAKHRKVIQELEEEKCKHEHDTAQGDDITYGLEMERTRLRQELEMERSARKKLEKEVKKQLEMADEERARQKQIVLLLLAERKKIIVKYIEERKRSEDLAQVNMLNVKVIANKFWELMNYRFCLKKSQGLTAWLKDLKKKVKSHWRWKLNLKNRSTCSRLIKNR